MKYVIVAKVLIDQKSKTFHYKKKKIFRVRETNYTGPSEYSA